VRERLREVAEEVAGARIDLLAVEAEGIGEAQHAAEHALATFDVAGQDQRVGQPERADREHALLAGQAVLAV
jgi:hypothetical protein